MYMKKVECFLFVEVEFWYLNKVTANTSCYTFVSWVNLKYCHLRFVFGAVKHPLPQPSKYLLLCYFIIMCHKWDTLFEIACIMERSRKTETDELSFDELKVCCTLSNELIPYRYCVYFINNSYVSLFEFMSYSLWKVWIEKKNPFLMWSRDIFLHTN